MTRSFIVTDLYLSRYMGGMSNATRRLLAELMIPDGAHSNAEDWTYFFLNQAPANTIAPVFSDAQSTDSGSANSSDQPLLYVINLVKTKKDAAAPRWAVPFIDVNKNLNVSLLLSLEEAGSRLLQYALDTHSSIFSEYVSNLGLLTHNKGHTPETIVPRSLLSLPPSLLPSRAP